MWTSALKFMPGDKQECPVVWHLEIWLCLLHVLMSSTSVKWVQLAVHCSILSNRHHILCVLFTRMLLLDVFDYFLLAPFVLHIYMVPCYIHLTSDSAYLLRNLLMLDSWILARKIIGVVLYCCYIQVGWIMNHDADFVVLNKNDWFATYLLHILSSSFISSCLPSVNASHFSITGLWCGDTSIFWALRYWIGHIRGCHKKSKKGEFSSLFFVAYTFHYFLTSFFLAK